METEQLTISPNRTAHLLACLTEEAGEVSQLVGKCLRFGIQDYHPKTGSIPNIELLENEINDFIAISRMLGIEPNEYEIKAKIKRVEKYMQYAKENGAYKEDV